MDPIPVSCSSSMPQSNIEHRNRNGNSEVNNTEISTEIGCEPERTTNNDFCRVVPTKDKYENGNEDKNNPFLNATTLKELPFTDKDTTTDISDVKETRSLVSPVLSEDESKLKEKASFENLEKDEFADEDTSCGIGPFHPKWLQAYGTPRMYLVLYSIIGVLQGAYYTYMSGCVSTLEKRFTFNSQTSSYIFLVKEIAPLFFGISVGYFGGKKHIPRLIAFAMLLTIISCIITVFPYFLYGSPHHLGVLDQSGNKTEIESCDGSSKLEKCEAEDFTPTYYAVFLLVLGSCIDGFGGMVYFTVGIAYMDNNSKKRNSPFYLGIAFATRLLGPIFGYLMCSAFLNLYENPFVDPGYGPEDPRWIGAWWIGFVLEAILLSIFTIPLAMFPRSLPGQKPPSTSNNSMTWKQTFVDLLTTLKRLAKNPVFLLLSIDTCFSAIGNAGLYIILPKYMEYQFRLTAADASLYSGPVGLVAMQLAIIIGGFLIWKTQLSAKYLTSGLAISELVSVVGYLILMIPQCENVDLFNVGLNSDGLILQNECNTNCFCTTATFTPICGPDGKTTYFSPCYAGCTEVETHGKMQVFNNCSCVIDDSANTVTAHSLKKGFCVDEKCWNQALAYMIILPTFHFITNILRVGHTLVLLRCISPKDKSVALGFFDTILTIFGFLPTPIIFGALVDSVCLVWEKSCGKTGNCWFYDTETFNYKIHGVSATFTFFSALCLFGVYFLRSRVSDLYEEEHIEQSDKMNGNDAGKQESNVDAVTAF